MKAFDEIIGHEKIKEHLQNAIKLGKISHAYIFNGESGSGKKTVASVFAKTLQCETVNGYSMEQLQQMKTNEVIPCDQCHSCVQAESGNQPDIIWIKHEKPTSIGVDDIREQLIGDMQIKPYSSKYKIYIIDEADKLTQQAQNAILKTVEEPPAYGIIILLTNNADVLLTTILSRCVKLDFRPVSNAQLERYLIDKFQVPDYTARFATAFAQGKVGRAEQIVKSDEFVAMKDEVLHTLKYASEMTISELMDAVKTCNSYKLTVDDYIDLMAMWFRDVLAFKSTKDSNILIFKDELTIIKRQAEKSSYEGLEDILKAMDKAKTRIHANVNFDLAIELMLLTMRENC